jgi:hypothetical protein
MTCSKKTSPVLSGKRIASRLDRFGIQCSMFFPLGLAPSVCDSIKRGEKISEEIGFNLIKPQVPDNSIPFYHRIHNFKNPQFF